jgi:hypothetical protein
MGGKHLKKLYPCKHCDQMFMARPYDYVNGKIMYCSRECYTATRPRGFGKSTITDYERKIASQKRNPIQFAARKKLEHALRTGRVRRWPCAICNEPKTEGHHYHYARPLDVFWLCRKHHVAVHNGRIFLPMAIEPREPAKEWPRGRSCPPPHLP